MRAETSKRLRLEFLTAPRGLSGPAKPFEVFALMQRTFSSAGVLGCDGSGSGTYDEPLGVCEDALPDGASFCGGDGSRALFG